MADDAFPFDFFISRRGSVSALAQQVADVLEAAGHKTLVQDYDFSRGGDFVADIHQALKTARHLMILHTADYDTNIWTQKEFSNFLAAALPSGGSRRVCVLRCDDSLPAGLLHGVVFGDLVGVTDPAAQQKIILATASGEPMARRRAPTVFGPATMPSRNAYFTGRAELLEAMRDALATASSPTALTQAAVHGLGGVGKTSLAREYIERFAADYAGIWWITATSREAALAGLADLAARLDPRMAEATEMEDAAGAALAAIERAAGLPFLLVYDNVPSPTALDGLLPARGAHVVLTSRWAEWGGRARELTVAELPEEEAADFLVVRAGRDDRPGALRLARLLGCLPLALDHAGAYVKLAMVGFDAYARDAERLIARAPLDAAYPRSVAATFELAITVATERCAGAATLLEALAYFSPDDIPLALLDDAVLPELERAEAVMALVSVSLIRRETGAAGTSAGLPVHRLVQAVVRARLDARERGGEALSGAIERLVVAFPENFDLPSNWPLCRRLLPHLTAVRLHAARCDHASDAFAAVLYVAGAFTLQQGLLAEAQSLCHEAVTVGERVFGREHPAVLASISLLGAILNRQGRLAEAEPLLDEAVTVGERVLGREDPLVLHSMTILGGILASRGRASEAEPLLREAVVVCERVFGRDDRATMASIGALAAVLRDQDRLDEAEPFARQAVAIAERQLGRGHPSYFEFLNILASLLWSMQRPAEAEPMFREVLLNTEQMFGRDHPLFQLPLNNLGAALRDMGRLAEAEPLFRESLEIGERIFGRDHPSVDSPLANLARLLRDTGRVEAAEPLYRELLSYQEARYGHRHHRANEPRIALAALLRRMGRLDEAEPLLRESLEIGEQTWGRDHPNLDRVLLNLAHLLQDTGRDEAAEPLFREILSYREAHVGRRHAATNVARNDLAALLRRMGRFAEAKRLRRQGGTDDSDASGARPEPTAEASSQEDPAEVLYRYTAEVRPHFDGERARPLRRPPLSLWSSLWIAGALGYRRRSETQRR